MKATEDLKNDHEVICNMLNVLEKMTMRLQRGDKLNSEHLQTIIEFLQLFADKFHHGKEETHLFPTMETAGISKEHGPIGVMLSEHDMGRGFIKGIKTALEKYHLGIHSAVRDIIENGQNYITLLRNHIHKENNILFPMADRVIGGEKANSLYSEFENVINETGKDNIAKYIASVESLRKIYN